MLKHVVSFHSGLPMGFSVPQLDLLTSSWSHSASEPIPISPSSLDMDDVCFL